MDGKHVICWLALWVPAEAVAARPESSRGDSPVARHVVVAGQLEMALEQARDGLRVQSLRDTATGQELLADSPRLPLFALIIRRADGSQETRLHADGGWRSVEVAPLPSGPGIAVRWDGPAEEGIGPLSVEARAVPDSATSALAWELAVRSEKANARLWQVVFPQLAIAELSEDACVFFPRGPGEVQKGVWRRAFRYSGTYPNGWTAMAFEAAYDPGRNTGIYVALHDPWGSTKDITAESLPEDRCVVLRFSHPVPNMGQAGTGFTLRGQAVWRLLRGDWFDAAVAYRDWARREARWYPPLSPEGRSDTPLWMRELCVWAVGGGAPADCVPAVKKFAAFMGVPVGFHWYNWHRIPFDNDYPHYFPAKEGFVEGVKELQAAGVFVMPYINGRLWDTRDQGTEDLEFTRLARPAATKDAKGEPYTETYGSKESDGSAVRLGVMCPATPLWQDRVGGIVGRLLNECGLNAVYIDQVAAASPKLCFDATHGHPLGGGHWWTEGYWRLLDQVRHKKPEACALTTECNAEPYARWFDAYLTWHWQHEGQVPAFPAVYGGALQMFGRAYRGGQTKDLALRMKAGQQLVFGEQIGWIHPGVVEEKQNAEFLRQLVRLRWHLRRYFYAGEMVRPPRLQGQIPTVKADWQWSGTWWVTGEAILAGAWRLPRENRLVLMFVNVSDQRAGARLDFDGRRYGLRGDLLRATRVTADGPAASAELPLACVRDLDFPARQAWAWEIEPGSK